MNYIEDKNKIELKVPVEVYSRVVGYFRPVYVNGREGTWNKGKTQEYRDRKVISIQQIKEYVKEEALI